MSEIQGSGVGKTGALGNQTRLLQRMGNQTAASESGDTWPTDARSKPGSGNHRFGKLELMMILDFQKINFYVPGNKFVFRFP